MASLFQRPNSPFYWVKYRDPVTGKTIRKSTECRVGDQTELRRARSIRDTHSLAENKSPANSDERWDWVVPWIKTTYSESLRTRQTYLTTWKTLASFLTEHHLHSPRHVKRAHCFQYVAWRKERGSFKGKRNRPIHHNTVICDTKVLSKILQEAVNREIIDHNPAARLGLKKIAPKQKGEFNAEQLQYLRDRIASLIKRARTDEDKASANFYYWSFEISAHQLVRLNETHINLQKDVNLKEMEITFPCVKGGRGASVTKALNPALADLFRPLIKQGVEHIYKRPTNLPLKWFKLFDKIRRKRPDFADLCHHALRGTGISQLEAGGVSEQVTMKLVNHHSVTVHRGYRKMKQSEMTAAWDKLEMSKENVKT